MSSQVTGSVGKSSRVTVVKALVLTLITGICSGCIGVEVKLFLFFFQYSTFFSRLEEHHHISDKKKVLKGAQNVLKREKI